MSKAVTRLYESFQPEHYDLSLDLDLASNQAAGKVVIRGKKAGRPSQRITLHAKYLSVKSAAIVKHDKKQGDLPVVVTRLNQQKSLDELRLHTDDKLFAGDYTLTIEFVAPIQSSMHGMYRSGYKLLDDQEKTLISTQFESHHAREAFPCVDEPEAKATFSLELTAAAGQTVLSNMPAISQDQHGDKQTVAFDKSPCMSTYLLAWVVGELQSKSAKTKDGVDVTVWSTLEHRPEALDFAVDTGKRCIEFFNDYYGVPYPLPKCDMVSIPSFSSGAMENWGLVTYREACLLADPATSSQSAREVVALVVCHELSHQWFGNLVTMRWWDNLWLNESFANVMEYVAVDGLFPDWQIFNIFAAQEGLAAFRRDSIAGVQAIKTEVRHPDEISSLFDPSIVYAKGGRLLNMLRNYIGDDDFRRGLTAYFEKHKYANTTGDDLWAALAQASGKNIAGFMNPWLQQSGFPLVTIDQQASTTTISQSHFLIDPAKADSQRRWPVPLLASDPAVPALLDGRTISSQLPTADFVRLNSGAVGHYVVYYCQPPHREWLAGLAASQELSETERLMLLSDSALLARNGTASLADTMRLLERYAAEASEPVWDTIALVLADARRFIDSDPELETAIKALIRKIIEAQYQRLGWDEQPGESNHDTKLRGTILALGTYSEHPAIKARALELFETYKQDESAVSSELRGIIFTAAVRYEDETASKQAFDYLLELEETTSNPNLKNELLGSLSATRSTKRGAQLLARLKDVKKVRLHDVDHWLVLLMRSRYNQDQAWRWLRDEWGWIETTFEGDKSYDVFPRYAAGALNTRQRVEEYKDFFGPKSDQTALARNIAMGIEELESRIAWIERDLEPLQAYFK